jgi:hypothetical protein
MKFELREMTMNDYGAVYALWKDSEGLKLNSEDDSRESIKHFPRAQPRSELRRHRQGTDRRCGVVRQRWAARLHP